MEKITVATGRYGYSSVGTVWRHVTETTAFIEDARLMCSKVVRGVCRTIQLVEGDSDSEIYAVHTASDGKPTVFIAEGDTMPSDLEACK